MPRIRNTLTYANVMASFAVFLALGGAAFAVTQVKRNSVSSASIRNAAVTGKDVKDESLTGADVKESTLALPGAAGLPGVPGDTRLTGPAGGDLTGSYPTPQIGPAAVGTAELAGDSVTGSKIANDAVDEAEIAAGAVSTVEIDDGAVGATEIAENGVSGSEISASSVGVSEIISDSVGGDELKDMVTATSAGVGVNAGTPQNVSVTCPGGRVVVGGGYAWLQDEANSIIANAPSETDPNHSWDVRGMVGAGSNTLFAWANCLAP